MTTTSEAPHIPANDKSIIPSSLKFPVVGIGASAGGLHAIQRFLENMPSDNGMAFVVIMHLSPTHQSTADAVLQRVTKMPVIQVKQTVRIEKNHVYVIPPNKHLQMNDGHLLIEDLVRPPGKHIAVDIFFRALADAHKDRSVGIILSGTGSDGAIGLARLKEQGGVSFAQRPDHAEHDGMPQAAIAMGNVDFVLPVVDMPQKLIDLWHNAQKIQLPPLDDSDAPLLVHVSPLVTQSSEDALREVISLLRTRTGHDFRYYKRATVLRRLERRLQVRAVPDIPSYASLLKTDTAETSALLKDMLIGVTNFFRDREAFEALERDVLPALFADKPANEQIRAWSAACATGEEAYSLAMLLNEHAALQGKSHTVQVFATDIDDQAISRARTGVYPDSIVTDVPPSRMREFFSKDGSNYRVKKSLRDNVLFASHNLLRDPPFSKLDLISCRNLLIYLNREIQEHVLQMFHFALNPGGFLFLGNSESAEIASGLFTPVDKKNRIYRARTQSRSMRAAPFVPGFGSSLPRSSPVETPDPGAKKRFSFAEVHQRVLAQHAPPSVIVNSDSNIVHMSDRAGRFLHHAGGEPSRNLIALVQPELRLELRTALFQATQSKKSVEARRVQLRRGDKTFYVNMTARPFHDDDAASDFVLVLFDEVEETMGTDTLQASGDRKDAVLHQLENELQRTKEQLQETVEHSETSTEELKASNEELQAINEELRSATEELETSKEELQSVNEELITVNFELKVKVEETSKVNDDLTNLIASTNIATVFIDKGMRIKRFTPRATDIFSMIPSDTGRSLLDITHRLEYPALAEDVDRTFESLALVEREVASKDGRFYIARLLPYRTVDDRIEGAIMTFIDITRRREAEEKLLASEAHMRLVAESTKDYAIITMDEAGVVTSWNTGAARIFGYTEDEMLGQSGDILFVPEDRESHAPEAEREKARTEGRAEDERWHLRKDGTRFYCSGVVTPLEGGNIKGYAKIARDMTSRVLADRNEGRLQPEAHAGQMNSQAASELKDEFFAVMSHELKHPLNLIHINAELLSRMPEIRNSSVSIKAAQTIRDAAISQAQIINDLLDLSRLNTGKLALNVVEVNLSMVVDSIVQAARHDPAAAGLSIEILDQTPPVMINADLVRVEQVVWNLISNAVKFTEAGKVTVELTQDNDQSLLTVSDTGQGIAPETLPYVFDMFVQGSAPRKTAGMGIGLALVKQIMELHGGSVQATSDGLGAGSRFSISFPRAGEMALPAVKRNEVVKDSLAGLKVLLVDDMEDVVTSFKMLLEFEKVEVITATSAQDGLQILAGKPDVDVILSDISMPGMDGYGFIKAVREQARYADIPAIAITGMGRIQDVELAYAAGFSGHISKPVTLSALGKSILTSLHSRSRK